MAEELSLRGYDVNGNAREVKLLVQDQAVYVTGTLLKYIWAGSGIGGAPSATLLRDGTLGADLAGITTGLTYHVVSGVWVATGGTIANLYGA